MLRLDFSKLGLGNQACTNFCRLFSPRMAIHGSGNHLPVFEGAVESRTEESTKGTRTGEGGCREGQQTRVHVPNCDSEVAQGRLGI